LQAKSEVEKRIKNNEDIFDRPFFFWKDDSKLPKYILNNRAKYNNLLK
jgi:hypothetical protein